MTIWCLPAVKKLTVLSYNVSCCRKSKEILYPIALPSYDSGPIALFCCMCSILTFLADDFYSAFTSWYATVASFFSKSPTPSCIATILKVQETTSMYIQIRTIMVDNIEKILERGDRIELLVDKTGTMQDSAFHFRKQSKRLRRALWMKNAKLL